MKHKFLKCGAAMIAAALFGMTGCSSNQPASDAHASGFSNGYYSFGSEACLHLQEDHLIHRLDYETMHEALLCSKPNCDHTDPDCIERRLNGKVPVIENQCAYYFVDEEPDFVQDEEGKTDLKLGTALYRYDLKNGNEKKLAEIPGLSIAKNCYGWLLHENTVYCVGTALSRMYDENGMVVGAGGSGGEMNLITVDLSTQQMRDLGSLYDTGAIAEYYPWVNASGEVYMKGLFDDKLYFDVCFYDGERYKSFVTYYDLTDGSYHGTPEDYGNIDFASAAYCTENALVICRTGSAAVYRKGEEQPVELKDACFYEDIVVSVFDDLLFCDGKVFDLNTKEARALDVLKSKNEYEFSKVVVSKYGDSYIVSDYSMQENFKKIPAEQLLKP